MNITALICIASTLAYKPEQIHIALTGIPHETQITWTTQQLTFKNRILYGSRINEHCYFDSINDNIHIKRFNNDKNNDNKNTLITGRITFIYHSVIDNLLPGHEYCYKIRNSQENSFTYHFKMFDYNKNNTKILVMGDMDISNETIASIQHYLKYTNVDFILHNGDIAYDLYEQNGKVGDDYMNAIQDITAHHYYMTSPGNHERTYNFSHYKNRFRNRNLVHERHSNYFWSIDTKYAKIITINTDLYYDDEGKPLLEPVNNIGNPLVQFDWLEKEVCNYRKNKKTQHNWIIIFGHHPLYCSNINSKKLISTCMGPDNQTYIMRNGWTDKRLGSLEDLFKKYKVNLYISSHVHAYERLYPTLYGKIVQYNYTNPQTYVHLMTGNAGVNNDMDVFTTILPFSAKRINGTMVGYGILNIVNSTQLKWKQLNAKTHIVVDEMTLLL